TVTDSLNGCTSTDTACVTLGSSSPVDANAGPDLVINCSTGLQVTLQGSSTTVGATFSWVAINGGHIVSGGSTATPIVNAAGCYVLTVTNPVNGCIGRDTACVTIGANLTNANAGADLVINCFTGPQGTRNGSSTTASATFSWAAINGGNIVSGNTTAHPVVNAAGCYVLTVTDTLNGC